jgi:hypothetical protein
MLNGYGSPENLPLSSDALPALTSRWRRWLSVLAFPFTGRRRKDRASAGDRQAVDEWWAEARQAARPRRRGNRDHWIG